MNEIEVISKETTARDKTTQETLGPSIESAKVSDVYYINGESQGLEGFFCDQITQQIADKNVGKGKWVFEPDLKMK